MNSNAGRGLLKAIVLVGVLFAIMYFVSYNKWINHDFDKVDITYKLNNNEENYGTEKQKYIEDVTKDFEKIYSSINYEMLQFNFGEEFFNIYYDNAPVTDEYYIYTGIINLIKNDMSINCNLETVISKDNLHKEINSLFGDVKYQDKSFTTKNQIMNVTFNNDVYSIKINDKCSGFDYAFGGIKTVYQRAERVDDSVYIYEKALYVEKIQDSNGNIIFNYHDNITKNSKVIANSFEKVDINTLPTYVFKYTKINNQYTLQTITKK